MAQNNDTVEGYDDPNMGGHFQNKGDAAFMLPFDIVQQYLNEGEPADNGYIGDEDLDNEDDNEDVNSEGLDSDDINNQPANNEGVNFDGVDFSEAGFNEVDFRQDDNLNEINFDFEAGDSLFPSPPNVPKSSPHDGFTDEGDLFGDLPKAHPASQKAPAPAPASPGILSALSFPQTDPVIAASHPPQTPEPAVEPTSTFAQLNPADVSDSSQTWGPGPAVPEITFTFPAIDPAIAGEVSSAAQPRAPMGVAASQPHLPQPNIPTAPNPGAFVPAQGQISGPALAVSNNNLYRPDELEELLPSTRNPNQDQYPLDPLLGQGNGGNQAAVGRYGNRYQYSNQPYGNSAYLLPPAQPVARPYGMYPNMQTQQRQFTPSRAPPYGQPTTSQRPGYPVQMPQHMPAPMNLPGQGYPMTSAPGAGPFPSYNPQGPSAQAPMRTQAAYPPQPNPPETEDQVHPLNRGRMSHRRSRRASPTNDASRFYARPTGLRDWGPLVPGHREPEPLFRYYQHTAELRPALTFTREQLITFFLGRGHPNPRRNLTLWIQNVAAQSNDRYPNGGASTKCRYKHCPSSQNTIMKGFFRVAFDEFSDLTGSTLNPMHNAGYMHLHCFEKMFDLGYLIHHGAAHLGFRILPDRRTFAHESRNPAAITRDHGEMGRTYDDWVEGQRDRADYIENINTRSEPGQHYSGLKPSPQMVLPHDQRLGCRLVDKHLSLQVRGREKTRNTRGGPHLGVHRGDLDLLMRLKRQRLMGGVAVVPAQPAQPAAAQAPAVTDAAQAPVQGRGRKRAHEDEYEDEDEEKDLFSGSGRSRQRRRLDNHDAQEFSSPEYPDQAQTEPTSNRGRKRAIDDVEASSPSPETKRAKPFHQMSRSPTPGSESDCIITDPYADSINVAYQVDDDEEEDNYDNNYNTTSPSPPHQATPPTHTHTNTTNTPTPAEGAHNHNHNHHDHDTRSRARDASADIVDELTTQAHLTRASAHAFQSRLGAQPAHVRAQVLAAVPAEYAALVLPPPPPPPGREEGGEEVLLLHDDRLGERISVLDAAQRRGVEAAVARQEMRESLGGRRKLQSL